MKSFSFTIATQEFRAVLKGRTVEDHVCLDEVEFFGENAHSVDPYCIVDREIDEFTFFATHQIDNKKSLGIVVDSRLTPEGLVIEKAKFKIEPVVGSRRPSCDEQVLPVITELPLTVVAT